MAPVLVAVDVAPRRYAHFPAGVIAPIPSLQRKKSLLTGTASITTRNEKYSLSSRLLHHDVIDTPGEPPRLNSFGTIIQLSSNASTPVSQAVLSRVQFSLHATRRTTNVSRRAWCKQSLPGRSIVVVLRPGMVAGRGSTVVPLRPCMTMSTPHPPPPPALMIGRGVYTVVVSWRMVDTWKRK